MARRRTIPPDLFGDSTLARCSFGARWLFTALWTLADREGRLSWVAKAIEGHAFPFDVVDLDSLVDELVDAGWLQLYRTSSDDVWFAQIDPEWWRTNQSPYHREPESRIPPPLALARAVTGARARDPSRIDASNSDDVERSRSDSVLHSTHGGDRLNRSSDTASPLNLDVEPLDSRKALRVAKRRRRRDAEALLGHWFNVADRQLAPRGKARASLLDALQVHLLDHNIDDLVVLVDWLAQEPWWRGKKAGGPDRDLFSKQPISWMRRSKPAEFADRVEQARDWHARGAVAATSSVPGVADDAATWLASNDASWLLRQRDRAASYQRLLTPENLSAAAAAAALTMSVETARALIAWLETR